MRSGGRGIKAAERADDILVAVLPSNEHWRVADCIGLSAVDTCTHETSRLLGVSAQRAEHQRTDATRLGELHPQVVHDVQHAIACEPKQVGNPVHLILVEWALRPCTLGGGPEALDDMK